MKFFDNVDIITSRSIHHMPYMAIFYIIVLLAYNKTTQDFAEFWEIWGNFKAKTKTEDEGILKKGKWSSSWFLLLHIT